jgi:hypothetical protein
MDDDALLQAFESGSYPFEQWNHRAHVRVAYLYLCRLGPEAALERMRAGIRAYNARHNVQDGPESGYHETITQAFLRLIHQAIRNGAPSAGSQQFCEANAPLLDRRVLLKYYTKGRIMDAEAKVRFVEPDIAPLDDAAAPPAGDERTAHELRGNPLQAFRRRRRRRKK